MSNLYTFHFYWHEKCEFMWWPVFGQLTGWPAGRVSVCGKHFNIVIFSGTVNIINVKLCMMYLFSFTRVCHFQRPWFLFQGQSMLNNLNWKLYVLIWLSWNFVWLFITSSRSWIDDHYFWFLHVFKGDNWHLLFKKNF